MMETVTFAEKVYKFNKFLSTVTINLPDSFELINPFAGNNMDQIKKATRAFYTRYYNDTNKRIMILGSSPARRGTAITGIPYEDAQHLYEQMGIKIDGFHVNKAASDFLYDVIESFGGCEKFYSKFYLNFICPLGIVKTNDKGHKINCNYYENKKIQKALDSFILTSIKKQLTFNIDNSICYCIGSGENYEYLKKLNNKYNFFKHIIPLEHPRFIMQYNSKNKDKYMEKYLKALNIKINENNHGDLGYGK